MCVSQRFVSVDLAALFLRQVLSLQGGEMGISMIEVFSASMISCMTAEDALRSGIEADSFEQMKCVYDTLGATGLAALLNAKEEELPLPMLKAAVEECGGKPARWGIYPPVPEHSRVTLIEGLEDPDAFLQQIPADERECLLGRIGREGFDDMYSDAAGAEDIRTFLHCVSRVTVTRIFVSTVVSTVLVRKVDSLTATSSACLSHRFADLDLGYLFSGVRVRYSVIRGDASTHCCAFCGPVTSQPATATPLTP